MIETNPNQLLWRSPFENLWLVKLRVTEYHGEGLPEFEDVQRLVFGLSLEEVEHNVKREYEVDEGVYRRSVTVAILEATPAIV
jgi:hypothetical protein